MLYEVINTWDNSSEYMGTLEECYAFLDNISQFTTQTFEIREIPDDDEED